MKARGNRADVVIATKVSQHTDFQGLTAANIKAAANASLRRLDPTASISTAPTSTSRKCPSRRSSARWTSW